MTDFKMTNLASTPNLFVMIGEGMVPELGVGGLG